MRCVIALLILSASSFAAEKLVLFASGLNEPFGMDFLDGKLVCTEFGGHRILLFDENGKAKVLAGGKKGVKDGKGEAAEFNAPHNLAVAPGGIIYVADTSNHRVRKLDTKTGEVTTIAGSEKGYAGDGGPAKDAKFDQAYHVSLDAKAENLFVCDLGNRRIRKIDLKTGMIETVAGNGKAGVPMNDAIAKDAPLADPRAIAVDSLGQLWILERSGHALRMVANGKIRTIAGGNKGFNKSDAVGVAAKFNGPKFLWIAADGKVLIADTENHVIRAYDPKIRSVIPIAGTGEKGKDRYGDNPRQVMLSRPHGVAIGPDGTMYIADSDNGRILRTVKD